MATTKKTSPTKMATTAIKKKKAAASRKVSLTPNSYTMRSKYKGDDSSDHLLKATDHRGKYNTIKRTKGSVNKKATNYHGQDKMYTSWGGKPTYKVTSENYRIGAGPEGSKVKHFEKSVDTTGYAAGKKSFTVVSKQKLPGGNMYKITKTKTGRKGAIDTINRMKKRARKPFTSKADHSKPLTTKKK